MYTWVTPCLSCNRTLKQTNFPMWLINQTDNICNVNECYPTFFLTWQGNILIRTRLSIEIGKHCNSDIIFGHLLIKKHPFTTFDSFGKHANSITRCENDKILEIIHGYALTLLLKIAQCYAKTLSASQISTLDGLIFSHRSFSILIIVVAQPTFYAANHIFIPHMHVLMYYTEWYLYIHLSMILQMPID